MIRDQFEVLILKKKMLNLVWCDRKVFNIYSLLLLDYDFSFFTQRNEGFRCLIKTPYQTHGNII